MEKQSLNRFVSKYNLAGLVESVKWESKDGSLTTSFISDDKSVDDMIDFIVQEQFIAQQEKSMIDSWFSAMEPMGLDVNSEAFADFFYPILSEYLSDIAKKMPPVYKEIYSEDEILALYNFMSSKEGTSITNKQSLAMEKGMLAISEDLVKLQENLAIALQDPKVIQSLKKKN